MTRPQRAVHARLWSVLGAALLAMLVVLVARRPGAPVAAPAPTPGAAPAGAAR